ncbi:Nucleotide-diphospho-sugar transferase family protein [Zostera marina]|uniref:Nucleotide-diphospho-sugar transferase family protein n=1 Tax=Zostera marina TaxID=29655 RepID=A0A0K9P7S2_ZOSMR|nr:Nucleotide-diphospho-sugar transferase family protein [Zostera marina]
MNMNMYMSSLSFIMNNPTFKIFNLSNYINSYNYKYVITAFILWFATILICVLITNDRMRGFMPLLSDPDDLDYLGDFSNITKEDKLLDRVLKKASMEDNTVILTVVNEAWTKPGSALDQFLESFHIGDQTVKLLDHLVIVSLDVESYKRCKSVHQHCAPLSTPGIDFSMQSNFMTDRYVKMMWRRIDFLGTVLQKGYNFIFTDADVLWFRNPLPMFHNEEDIQFSCDHYRGNPHDLKKGDPNGGFNFVKSNIRTIKFFKFWYDSRLKYPGSRTQVVLNNIKLDPYINEIGLRIRFLDTVYFGGFCEMSRDFDKVRTIHTNCCIGLNRKVLDLKAMLEDWKRFRSPTSIKNSNLGSWSVPKNCSMKPIV